VKIPTQLRDLVGGEPELNLESAATVGEALHQITESHPGLSERIMDESGQVRRFVNLYLGDEDVRFLEGLDTPLEANAVLSILPAVAGGL
jgi:molybdopterin synthase sulfur carrier subunit